jgi:hypothetical protein
MTVTHIPPQRSRVANRNAKHHGRRPGKRVTSSQPGTWRDNFCPSRTKRVRERFFRSKIPVDWIWQHVSQVDSDL